jgi:glucose-1-phosphate adenylyltransferase
MDVRQMLDYHVRKRAVLTVAAIPRPIGEAPQLGVMEVEKDGRIKTFLEKPQNAKPIRRKPGYVLASMGNYIFNADVLEEILERDANDGSSHHDFGRNILPILIQSADVFAYDFSKNKVPGMSPAERGYWRDVGEIDSYWEANMDLVSVTPTFNLYNEEWPIQGSSPSGPPAKFVFANEAENRMGIATDSLVSEGCIISGGRINRSILFPEVRINSYSYVTDSILMNGVHIGRHAKIRRAIIDKHVVIPQGMEIGYDLQRDRKRFTVSRGGIVVVPKEMKL